MLIRLEILFNRSNQNFNNSLFYKKHFQKASVKFIGPIYDKSQQWEYYNSAKVFVLTSRWESYGLVLAEARRFGCYLVSTDVGAARDLIGDNENGEYVNQEDVVDLRQKLQQIIDGETKICNHTIKAEEISWAKVLIPVVKKLRNE